MDNVIAHVETFDLSLNSVDIPDTDVSTNTFKMQYDIGSVYLAQQTQQ